MIEKDTSRKFELISKYSPSGDQPTAIEALCELLGKIDQH